MGCSRSTQRQLRRLRRRAAYLEIAQHGCAGIAGLLRYAFALAAHRARPCRTSGRQETSCRAMGLALFWPRLFTRTANCRGGRLGVDLDGFRRVALLAPLGADGGPWGPFSSQESCAR